MKIDKQNGNVDEKCKCGIYCISNSKYFYIGHSINIYKRWDKHKNLLSKGIHVNPIMQNVYNKYNELDPFIYEIVLECEIQVLQKEEGKAVLEFINRFPNKKCMNIANPISALENFIRDKNGNLINISEELAEPLKRGDIITTKRGKAPWKYVKIVQLDKEGNLIKIWDTIRIAEQELNINIHLKKHTCGSYQWQRYSDWLENPKGKVQHKHNIDDTVKLFDLNGNFIKEYSSAIEAAKETKSSHSSIVACLNNQYKTANGYLWSYTNTSPEYDNSKPRHNKKKIIEKWSNDILIETFTSLSKAALSIKVSPTTLRGHIIKNDLYKGFIWKFQK